MPDLTARISNLSEHSTIREVKEIVRDIFHVHFGMSSDATRMHDITNEFHEFTRAVSRIHRKEEFGDLLASLLAFSSEQDMSVSDAIRQSLLKIERRADIYATNGDKKNIAIFGGSFDPPHRGHVNAARAILSCSLDIREVWFMPANVSMSSKRLTDTRHRVAMCRLLEDQDPRIKFFGYEIDHNLSSETRNTISRLLQADFADQHRFHFVVSLDVANSIHTWAGSDELIRSVPFIVLPRHGYTPDVSHPWYLQSPHRYLSEASDLIEASSSRIRAIFQTQSFAGVDADVEKLLTPSVYAYICENSLYTSVE